MNGMITNHILYNKIEIHRNTIDIIVINDDGSFGDVIIVVLHLFAASLIFIILLFAPMLSCLLLVVIDHLDS
jgi:hypothetical protein